jgi:DnaJ-class molecular chaperone
MLFDNRKTQEEEKADMTKRYELKNGEFVRRGLLHGWTGSRCNRCNGTGELRDVIRCPDCAGTGDAFGVMPVQPPNLPDDTE